MSAKKCTAFYSAAQAAFWMLFCVAVSFAAVYLGGLGYSNSELGALLALGSVLGFLSGTALSAIIDRSEKFSASSLVWIVLTLQGIFYLVLLLHPERGVLTSVCYPLMHASMLSVNTLNLRICADFEHYKVPLNYGVSRSMGSLFYTLISMVLGVLVTSLGIRIIPAVALGGTALQFLANALLTAALTRLHRSEAAAEMPKVPVGRPLGEFLRENPKFCLLLIGSVLIFFAHNTTTTFLINLVENVGGDTEAMGYLSAFGAMVEIPTMLLYSRIFRRKRCSWILGFSFIFFTIKSAALALAPNMPLLYAAEALQAPSFAVYSPAIVAYVSLVVPYEDSAKGQSLAFGTTTVGGVIASLVSGHLYDILPVSTVLWIGAAVCAVGTVIVLRSIEKTEV